MEMETVETEQVDKLACLPIETPPDKQLWLVDQLTVLAEAFGESGEKVSVERLRIYTSDLVDLPFQNLKIAFTRARRELRFFPKIAELRELAGDSPSVRKELNEAGAIAAWHAVLELIRKWGVNRWTHSVYGPPPELDARTEYAVRCVGGLERINRASDGEFGYMQKQFVDAWTAYDTTKGMSLRDITANLDGELLSSVKRLAGL